MVDGAAAAVVVLWFLLTLHNVCMCPYCMVHARWQFGCQLLGDAACSQPSMALTHHVCWQLAMLLLVEWNGAEHDAEGIAFARQCRQTLKSMSREEGI